MEIHIKVFLAVCGFLTVFTMIYCENFKGNPRFTRNKGNNLLFVEAAHDKQGVQLSNSNRVEATDSDILYVNKQENRQESRFSVLGSLDIKKNVDSVDNGQVYYNGFVNEAKRFTEAGNTKHAQEMFSETGERKVGLPRPGQDSTTTPGSSTTDKATTEIEDGLSTDDDSNKDEKDNSDEFEAFPKISHILETDPLSDNDDDDDDDDDDDVEAGSWNTIPTDYYKCDKCICHDSTDGAIIHANCDHCKLRTIPSNLPRNTTYLHLNNNHVSFVINKLVAYQSLLTLALSSNKIKSIPNTTCSDSLRLHTLDLSDNEIWAIDDYSFSCLQHLKILFLQNNNIQTLTNFMLGGLRGLQHLDLSKNLLDTIESNAFAQTPQLKELNISKNKNMTYAPKKLNSTTFRPLKQLEILHIQGFSKDAGKYPVAVLLQLKSLKELNVDGVLLGHFESNLTALKNLTVLKIGVDNGRCRIKDLSESYFIGVPYLRHLFLTGCGPDNISALAYKANTLLEELAYNDVSYEFDSLFDSLSGLQNTSIKSLTINNVRKKSKRTACRSLDVCHVKNIKNMPHLTELNLENNLISDIQYEFFVSLPKTLEKLSVRKNTLHYLRSVIKNAGTLTLTKLLEVKEDLQNHVVFSDKSDLDDSSEAEDSTCTSEASTVQQTALSYSSLRSNSDAETESLSRGFTLPKNLRFYSAAQSFTFGKSLLSSGTKTNKVRYFNISNSYITDWGKGTLSDNIEVADLSENFCDYLRPGFIHRNSSLRELHAAGNFLGDDFEKDTNGDILGRYHRVRFIDFSRNHIRDLPSRFFAGLVNVEVINLSSNNLRSFNITMSHMKSLTFLNLSKNSISWIGRQSQDDLDTINLHNQVSIDLTWNRLPCTCAGLEVMQWLATTNVRILKKDFLQCEDENNELVGIGDLHERFVSLQRRCVSRTVIILIATFSILLVLVIALGTWMFRNRWKLYYLRNIAVAKLFGYKPGNKGEADQYKFDAYVLYSKQDSGFAMRECLQELEVKRGHKLCLEHRDFLLGSCMPLTIANAISNSRMTIPVITPDFWDSEWCEYGVQIAVVESVHTKRDVLHLLIYKPVPLDTMPRHLIKVAKDNSSNEYPPEDCDENVKTAFWDALSRTIGHLKVDDH